MVRFTKEIDAEIEGIESRLAKLYAERQDAVEFPKEPKDGSVIKFSVQFDNFGPTYRYVAYRLGAQWYPTGPSNAGRPLSWQALVEFMRKDISVQKGSRKFYFQVVDKWKTIY